MILTLAWKELREHQAIWLTMVIMTVILGSGVIRVASPKDQGNAETMAAITILGMAATYGVVCGAMMFAGEHEGGTMVFLDVYLGERGLLWLGKFVIGVVLVLAEACAVALALCLLKEGPPFWGLALLGQSAGPLPRAALPLSADTWFLMLPVVTLEAYAWGLLGSSLTRRVLPGAAMAVPGPALVWLISMGAEPQTFFTLRLVAALIVLVLSCSIFLGQSREAVLESPKSDDLSEPHRRFIELSEAFERDDWDAIERPVPDDDPADVPIIAQASPPDLQDPVPSPQSGGWHKRDDRAIPHPKATLRRRDEVLQANSGGEVLWWLTLQQVWGLFWALAGAGFLVGFFVPSHVQVLWPVATLLLGVACGTAAFAPEQRDLSYQFLAAQHFPLKMIWRFKILFWLTAAVLTALAIVLGGFLHILERAFFPGPAGLARDVPAGLQLGTLWEIMGPVLFVGVWLIYGFCTGQVFVWLCRKTILAVLLSGLVSAATLGLWFPSLLCRGMSGWQLWLPPLTMLAATYFLVRAWAGGRIKERKPVVALIAFGMTAAAWIVLNFAIRAWEVPDEGRPLDPVAFRASIPSGNGNVAGKKIQEAIALIDQPNHPWLARIAEAARLPVGVIEVPRADGQPSSTKLSPACLHIATELRVMAATKSPGLALEHLAQILALSRNLRNKAALESYLAGVEAERIALEGLDSWLARGKPAPDLLRRALDELNRHAAETPSPLDCLRTECFLSGGVVANPHLWTFASAAHGVGGRVPERSLVGAIALSLDVPWEAERKTRLWRLVWGGLFRAIETPHWQLPEPSGDIRTEKPSTRQILQGWLPAKEGPASSVSPERMAGLLDASWLADERLFCSVVRLRAVATRARWRVDASRQAVALGLYQMEEGKPAAKLHDLVPKYLPTGLPTDPYSGKAYHYRVSLGEHIERAGEVRAGQGIIWSTGPDRVDHGGLKHGARLGKDDAEWPRAGFDLITVVPHWP